MLLVSAKILAHEVSSNIWVDVICCEDKNFFPTFGNKVFH